MNEDGYLVIKNILSKELIESLVEISDSILSEQTEEERLKFRHQGSNITQYKESSLASNSCHIGHSRTF